MLMDEKKQKNWRISFISNGCLEFHDVPERFVDTLRLYDCDCWINSIQHSVRVEEVKLMNFLFEYFKDYNHE